MGEDAVFAFDGERFRPTARARSPWSDTQLHGGAAAGLLARVVERFNDDDGLRVSRLTVDLLKPVPNAPLQAHASTVRRGNRIHVVEAVLLSEGELVTRSTALLLRRLDEDVAIEPPSQRLAAPEDCEPRNMGAWMRPPGEKGAASVPAPGFREGLHTTIEVRFATRSEPGVTQAWVRLPVPLIEGEENSPLVRAAATSDFTNAFTNQGVRLPIGFINADISLYLHRYPVGEWLALETRRSLQPSGLGVSTAAMYDTSGPVGTVVEAVLANARR